MSNTTKTIVKASIRKAAHIEKIRLRKDLNADALFATMRSGFEKIKDHRPSQIKHTLTDTLMSAFFAMFSLKDPSLMWTGKRRLRAASRCVLRLHNPCRSSVVGVPSDPLLMVLAFLVDQIQQLCCPLFKAARKLYRTNRSYWEKIRYHLVMYSTPWRSCIIPCCRHVDVTLPCRKKRLYRYFKDQVSRFKNGNRKRMGAFVQKTGVLFCCVQNLANVSTERAGFSICPASSTEKSTLRRSIMTVRE